MAYAAKVIHMDEHRTSGPQLEDGFLRIANELFDAILRFRCTLKQQSVLLAIVRKTYGYAKKTDDVSASQLGELCGMARNHVTETLHQLAAMNVITLERGKYGMLVGINKHSFQWKETAKAVTNPESGLVPNQDSTSPESGLSVVPNQDGSIVPNQDTQKTTFQKTTSKREVAPAVAGAESSGEFGPVAMMASLPNLSKSVAADYLKFRKAMKKPLNSTAWGAIAKQVSLSGWAPDEAIAEAMAAGWQGIKAEWLANRKTGSRAVAARTQPPTENFAAKDYGMGGRI